MRKACPHQWADDRKEQLKALWQSGKTASQVAETMGGITRNAVIGQVRRMGLHRYTEHPPASRKVAQKAAVRARETHRIQKRQFLSFAWKQPRREWDWNDLRNVPSPHYAQVPEPAPRHLTVLNLGAHDCRWPYGDGPFTFCGHPALEEKPYCEFHCGLAYQGRR